MIQGIEVPAGPDAVDAELSEDDDDPGKPRPKWLHVRVAAGTFEQVVFGRNSNADKTRQRFEALLEDKVRAVDQACRLSDEQKQKLRLAGQGDIARFFRLVEENRQKYDDRYVAQDENQQELLQWVLELAREGEPLRATTRNGPFEDRSLFAKALKKHLTADQQQALARQIRAASGKPSRPVMGSGFGGVKVEKKAAVKVDE